MWKLSESAELILSLLKIPPSTKRYIERKLEKSFQESVAQALKEALFLGLLNLSFQIELLKVCFHESNEDFHFPETALC